MYGAVISQASSDIIPTQLLTVLFESELSNPRPRYPPSVRAPTLEQLSRTTVVRILTENYDGVCTICHEEMISGQHVRHIHHCSHMFHQLCIDTWFAQRSTCPTCRYDVRI